MTDLLHRLLAMLFGLILYALGIVITVKADVGYAPWEVFHVGLAETTGLSLGIASIAAGIIIVILVTALGEKLGLGTIASMVLTGVFIDLILFLDVIKTAGHLAVGILMLIAGMFIISFGSYFYIKAAFGVGPRDNLMIVLARKTRVPVGLCRCLVEMLVTFLGWLLGGMVGIGTVISFFAIGFCVQVVLTMLKLDVTVIKHETLHETLVKLTRKDRIK